MIYNNENDIIEEVKTLVDKAEEFKADIDAYCDFMKQMFLKGSTENQSVDECKTLFFPINL